MFSMPGAGVDGDDLSHGGGGVLGAARLRQRHGRRLQPALGGKPTDTGIIQSPDVIHLSFLFKLTVNTLTAATSLGVQRFRVLNTTINIKDIL
jgi:hypothetical protein